MDAPVQQVNLGIYVKDGLGNELRQGEIVSNVTRYIVNSEDGTYLPIKHPFIIIAAQDCDLLQDYAVRQNGEAGSLCEVLLYPAQLTAEALGNVKGSDIKKRIENNKDERYHLLEEVKRDLDIAGEGIPSLIVDFKKMFTLTAGELQRQIDASLAARRTRLEMPYREHFQTRAAFYFQRVMLPEPHRAPQRQ